MARRATWSSMGLPAEVLVANHRVMKYQDEENEGQLRFNLDLIDEVRMGGTQISKV